MVAEIWKRQESSNRTGLMWIFAAAVAGWAWLAVMLVAVLSASDAASLGPGMALLDRFSAFSTLPPEMRRALARLCTTAPLTQWSVGGLGANLAMWTAMVLAMMLPSAAPALKSTARRRRGVYAMIPVMAGYVAAWMVFAIMMTLVSAVLVTMRVIDGPMGAMVSTLAATTLAAAGLYQFTPLKRACLDRCRLPPRPFGIAALPPMSLFVRGIARGIDCLGCCWALMAAMLAVGVMNIVWMVGLTAVMALEKALPGDRVRWFIGIGLIGLAVLTFGQSPGGLKLFGLA